MPPSNVPAQQLKQIAEAEALHAQYYGTPDDPAAPGDPAPAAPPADPAAAAPADPPADPPVAAAPPAEAPVDYDTLLQQHRTLQGKYEAESTRATEQNDAMLGRIHELEQLLSSPPAPADPAAPATSIPAESLLTAQEMEDYGQDMIDVVKRAAREEVGTELNTLRAENESLRQQVGGVQQTTAVTARQTMLNDLDREMSEWRQINKDPVFVQWAEDHDTFSGQRRIDMLRAAFEQNNYLRVLAFFKGFLAENAAYQTTGNIEPARTPQVDLNSLVAPGRASDGDVPRTPEVNTKIYTPADISQFYADVNRGVYKSDPAEKDRIERDIFLAQSEGRISG